MDKAHKETDKIIEEMEAHLTGIYKTAQKEIQKTADDYFSQFAKQDEIKRKAVDQGKLEKKEYQRWRRTKIFFGKRYTALQEQITGELLHINETAVAYVNGRLPDIYVLNYNSFPDSVIGDLKGYSFTLTDPQTVMNLATKDSTLLPLKYVNEWKDRGWNAKTLNAEVLQGLLQGDTMNQLAERIQEKTLVKNKNFAMRTARTMATSAQNKGRLDSYKVAESDGIILEKKWMSSNQPGRTRNWHLPGAFESLSVPIDQPFVNGAGSLMYPGDPSGSAENVGNCRCTMISKVKGFDEKRFNKVIEDQKNNPAAGKTAKQEPKIKRKKLDK